MSCSTRLSNLSADGALMKVTRATTETQFFQIWIGLPCHAFGAFACLRSKRFHQVSPRGWLASWTNRQQHVQLSISRAEDGFNQHPHFSSSPGNTCQQSSFACYCFHSNEQNAAASTFGKPWRIVTFNISQLPRPWINEKVEIENQIRS